MAADESEPPVELVMRKRGDRVRVFVQQGEESMFFAEPRVENAGQVARAAMQTFGSRGWPELAGEESNGGAFQ